MGLIMNNVICGSIEIPLCFVQSISWGRRAKTYQHSGGYVSARGFETTEISLKVSMNIGSCSAFGIDFSDMMSMFDAIKTDRLSDSGVFYIAGFPIYPEVEFALTNINKTETSDITGSPTNFDADLVFSGVKAVKNVVRTRALELEPVHPVPDIRISVDDKVLSIQDSIQINEFITNPDSIRLSISIGSDMDLVSRAGFVDSLIDKGIIEADLPQGTTKYYIIQADLVDELLSLTGSIYPHQANQIITKTYQDTTLKDIINDIALSAGIVCNCIADGAVDYYRAFKTPTECIRELQQSAGFIMSHRQGVLTCAFVPDSIDSFYNLRYIELLQDDTKERINGLYWFDGINQDTAGIIDNSAIKLSSAFRSSEKYAEKCLKFARYSQNSITVISDIDTSIDTHSCVILSTNDTKINCMCEWIEFDWINYTMQVELHYISQ